MNLDKIDTVIQFAIACASRLDSYDQRELAPIQLIKIVYLADFEYARKLGESFTDVPWKFHHFGPWHVGVFDRIEPVMKKINAGKREFQASDRQQGARYRLSGSSAENDILFYELEKILPLSITSAVSNTVKNYSNDTYGLLASVYSSAPMRNAKPGELLKFSQDQPLNSPTVNVLNEKTISSKERKRLKAKRDEMKERYRKTTEQRLQMKAEQNKHLSPYDEKFHQGVAWLDSLAGEDVNEWQGSLSFGDIWDADIRKMDEIP